MAASDSDTFGLRLGGDLIALGDLRLRYALAEEFDLCIAAPLGSGVDATFKLARYRAANLAVDTDKLWLQLEYR